MGRCVRGDDRTAAETRVADMCRRLLANEVIEDFRFELGRDGDAAT